MISFFFWKSDLESAFAYLLYDIIKDEYEEGES